MIKPEERPFIDFYRAFARAFFQDHVIVLVDYLCHSGGLNEYVIKEDLLFDTDTFNRITRQLKDFGLLDCHERRRNAEERTKRPEVGTRINVWGFQGDTKLLRKRLDRIREFVVNQEDEVPHFLFKCTYCDRTYTPDQLFGRIESGCQRDSQPLIEIENENWQHQPKQKKVAIDILEKVYQLFQKIENKSIPVRLCPPFPEEKQTKNKIQKTITINQTSDSKTELHLNIDCGDDREISIAKKVDKILEELTSNQDFRDKNQLRYDKAASSSQWSIKDSERVLACIFSRIDTTSSSQRASKPTQFLTKRKRYQNIQDQEYDKIYKDFMRKKIFL